MTLESELLKVLVSSVIGYFIGNKSALKKERRERIKERVSETIKLVRDTTNEAVKYFTVDMDQRERSASSAIIASNMKRISLDLTKLVRCCKKDSGNYFFEERSRYYDAVTSEPFGADTVQIVRHDHQRIRMIQESERFLIDRISTLEEV